MWRCFAHVTVAPPETGVSSDSFDELRELRGIGVPATDHAANALPLEPRRLGENCTEGERTCGLCLEVGEREQEPNSFLDLLLRHLDHAGEAVTEDLPVFVAYSCYPRAIGDS